MKKFFLAALVFTIAATQVTESSALSFTRDRGQIFAHLSADFSRGGGMAVPLRNAEYTIRSATKVHRSLSVRVSGTTDSQGNIKKVLPVGVYRITLKNSHSLSLLNGTFTIKNKKSTKKIFKVVCMVCG